MLDRLWSAGLYGVIDLNNPGYYILVYRLTPVVDELERLRTQKQLYRKVEQRQLFKPSVFILRTNSPKCIANASGDTRTPKPRYNDKRADHTDSGSDTSYQFTCRHGIQFKTLAMHGSSYPRLRPHDLWSDSCCFTCSGPTVRSSDHHSRNFSSRCLYETENLT